MKGKHSKKEQKTKFIKLIYLILIFLFLVFAIGCNFFFVEREGKEINSNLDVSNQITVENEKLVLKSNFEQNREKKIIYTFKNDILSEVRVLEIYVSEDEYDNQKEATNKKTGIEIIEANNNERMIYYRKLNFGTDEGLSYQEIYNKYMGIIGAYEIIK